jgi:hypothetical protein
VEIQFLYFQCSLRRYAEDPIVNRIEVAAVAGAMVGLCKLYAVDP